MCYYTVVIVWKLYLSFYYGVLFGSFVMKLLETVPHIWACVEFSKGMTHDRPPHVFLGFFWAKIVAWL